MSRSASPAATESAAVRARSAVTAAVSARLTTPAGQIDLLGGHVALPDGRFVVFVSPTGTVAACISADGATPARVVLVDLAPVAVRVRERARVEVSGTLTPAAEGDATHAWSVLTGESGGPTDALALELEPEVVLLTEGPRTVRVDLDDFTTAAVDAVAPYEASLLQHLASSHQGSVALLARSVEVPDLDLSGRTTVVPLRITSRGLTLRFCGSGSHRDVELPFAEPVEDPRFADRAVAELVHACQDRATFS